MRPGEVIANRYLLHRKIGEGGMGTVWHATHTSTERELALKLLHPNVAQTQDARRRFMREARASARIQHPNVVDVLDAGEADDGVLFLAMEMLDGVPLSKAMRSDPAMALRDFLVVMADACRALAAAHAVGIVHRDVKPGNIFIHRDLGADYAHGKVLDFGISKFLGDLDGATTTGALVGSPRYMSPEQVKGETSIDHRADIWALGVLLYRATSGRWPHPGAENFTALCVKIGTEPPVNIDEVAPGAPARLRALVKRCLQPVETRLADASFMADELEGIAADAAIGARTVAPRLKSPNSLIPSDSYRVRTPTTLRSSGDGTPLPGSVSHGAMSSAPSVAPAAAPRRVGLWVALSVVVVAGVAVGTMKLRASNSAGTMGTAAPPASASAPTSVIASTSAKPAPTVTATTTKTTAPVVLPSTTATVALPPRAQRRPPQRPPKPTPAPAPKATEKPKVPGENLGSGL